MLWVMGFSWVEDLSFLWLWLKEKEGLEGLDALPNFCGATLGVRHLRCRGQERPT